MSDYESHGTLVVNGMSIDLKKAEPVEISTMLVVSTGHVQQSGMSWMEANSSWHGEYGLLLCIDVHDDNAPEDVAKVIAFAKRYGVRWIQFDSDGPLYEGLDTYEW